MIRQNNGVVVFYFGSLPVPKSILRKGGRQAKQWCNGLLLWIFPRPQKVFKGKEGDLNFNMPGQIQTMARQISFRNVIF